MKLTAAQLRRHALLLKERAPQFSRFDSQNMAMSKAAEMEAEADLMDAKNGQYSGVAESAKITREYPLIGDVTTEGGQRISVEFAFGEAEIKSLEGKNIHIAWEWSFDPASGLDEGRLYRIYIGTTEDGPRLTWSDGRWRRLHSKKNFGKKYAFGGTWSSDKQSFVTLEAADPKISGVIKNILGHL